jgi:hypothetical protein
MTQNNFTFAMDTNDDKKKILQNENDLLGLSI